MLTCPSRHRLTSSSRAGEAIEYFAGKFRGSGHGSTATSGLCQCGGVHLFSGSACRRRRPSLRHQPKKPGRLCSSHLFHVGVDGKSARRHHSASFGIAGHGTITSNASAASRLSSKQEAAFIATGKTIMADCLQQNLFQRRNACGYGYIRWRRRNLTCVRRSSCIIIMPALYDEQHKNIHRGYQPR